MHFRNLCTMLTFLLLCSYATHTQEKSTEIIGDFCACSSSIETQYLNNTNNLQEISDFLTEIKISFQP